MIAPTIHLNGTSKDDIIEQYENASHALYMAQVALQQMAPNGRDYYIQGPDALRHAQAEHQARVDRINSVQAEIGALWAAVQDA